MKKIKIVWICELSNSQVREKLTFYRWSPIAILRHLLKKKTIYDLHIWNSNAIKEFETFRDIELHIISPHKYISSVNEFVINNIYYHIINTEDDSLTSIIYQYLFKKTRTCYKKNAIKICKIIENIDPDLIHIIGAENPIYGQSVDYLPDNKPLLVSLQTLLADPIFLKNCPWFLDKEAYRVKLESKILKKADYIGTKSEHFKTIIKNKITSNAKFLNIGLAVGVNINTNNCEKQYDFVYFSKDISKAIDYAIEAFALAKVSYPNITLNVVGEYNKELMECLQKRIVELNIESCINFTGKLITHNEVIQEIRKARFALLPLKADLVSGTIREAIANGLPVITTITPVTPSLNEIRESILLSEKGDFKGMAKNMCKLMSDNDLANTLKNNAIETIQERYSNNKAMLEWRESYYTVLASSNK